MEQVIQIGIYEYLNERYSHFTKENKVLYFRILMKRPQFLHAHIEWLYNNVNAFLGEVITRIKEGGMYPSSNVEMYKTLLRLNDEQDEDYAKIKYSTAPSICRQHKNDRSIAQRIRDGGIYAYVERYGGMSTGNKLEMYYSMITDPELFECHCEALLEIDDRVTTIFQPYYISSCLNNI